MSSDIPVLTLLAGTLPTCAVVQLQQSLCIASANDGKLHADGTFQTIWRGSGEYPGTQVSFGEVIEMPPSKITEIEPK